MTIKYIYIYEGDIKGCCNIKSLYPGGVWWACEPAAASCPDLLFYPRSGLLHELFLLLLPVLVVVILLSVAVFLGFRHGG